MPKYNFTDDDIKAAVKASGERKRETVHRRRISVQELYNRGLSNQAMADRLGVSKFTIINDLRAIRKADAVGDPTRIERILSMREAGMSVTKIAESFGVTRMTIYRDLREQENKNGK